MDLGWLSWWIFMNWRERYIERMEKDQMSWSMDHMGALWHHSEWLHYSLSVWLLIWILIGCYCAGQHSNSLLWFKTSRKTWEHYNSLSKLVFFLLSYLCNLFLLLGLQPCCGLGKKVMLIREEHWSLYFEIHGGKNSNRIFKPNQLSRVERCGKGKRMPHFVLAMPAFLTWLTKDLYT